MVLESIAIIVLIKKKEDLQLHIALNARDQFVKSIKKKVFRMLIIKYFPYAFFYNLISQ